MKRGRNGGSPAVVTFSRTDPKRLLEWWRRELAKREREELASAPRRKEIDDYKRSLK